MTNTDRRPLLWSMGRYLWQVRLPHATGDMPHWLPEDVFQAMNPPAGATGLMFDTQTEAEHAYTDALRVTAGQRQEPHDRQAVGFPETV